MPADPTDDRYGDGPPISETNPGFVHNQGDPMRREALAPGGPPALPHVLAPSAPREPLTSRRLAEIASSDLEYLERAATTPNQAACADALKNIRSHLAALTRERDEARADLLVKVGNELNEACEVAATAAKIEALEWVLRLHTYDYDAFAKPINEELARLRAEQEKPSDA